jgi:DNA-binding SARP family transcriptional activator
METDMQGLSLELPSGYYLKREPDLLVLRRLDGAMVGAFSRRGVAPEALQQILEETLEEDGRWELPADQKEAPNSLAIRSPLRVRFFGHFEIFCDEELITLGRNGKVLSILKYLLAHRSRPVSQDHLMGWLWPESNLKKARWSLNSAIHGLRKLLSECPASAPLNYILLEEGYYRLCSEVRVSTDVDDFDNRYERGRSLQRAHRMPEAAAEYERAISLYRGDYLVEDLYEDWTMVERERLSNAYMDMLSRLAHYYHETGHYQESIRACYRLLEKDRCYEDSYRVLMRCYAHLGLRGRALRQYRLCEKILRQEYGTSPSPDTQALYSSITPGQAIS